MDLLGDLGHGDQLTSARAENRVLQAKVKEQAAEILKLKFDNNSLLAEVELYRQECANLPSLGGGGESKEAMTMDDMANSTADTFDDFVNSGDGIYADDPAVTLPSIHGRANPLCCALHPDDSLLATGGADGSLNLCRWGSALAPGADAAAAAVSGADCIPCLGPVICTAFAGENRGRALPVVAAGCMDGSIRLASCDKSDEGASGADLVLRTVEGLEVKKHEKYVKTLCWSPSAPILASASADGTVRLTKVGGFSGGSHVSIEEIHSMHFDGPVEAMCFLDNGDKLCCYVRGTSYLSYFDLKDGCKQTKVTLNGRTPGTANFQEHVSFAVLSLAPSPGNNGKYIAAATDTSRNIVLEAGSPRIVRDLYGHKNDGFSNPKIAWSNNGKYIYGNSQDENCVCVWDVASTSIVKKMDEKLGGHKGFVRDMYSSAHSDTLATISFDKSAKIWLRSM